MKIRLLVTAIAVCMVSSLFAARVPLSDIQQRKNNKKAVSLFQPWVSISGGIIDTAGLHNNQKIALHDLVHNQPIFYGLQWSYVADTFPGNAETFTQASIVDGLAFRQKLLQLNPNIILIGEVRFYDAPPSYLPDNSPYWMRSGGNYVGSGYLNYRRLDYNSLAFQTHCANQCISLLESGVVDGIFLDWATNARLSFFTKIRELVGRDAVLIGNVNHHYTNIDQILPFLSGVYMESGWWGISTPSDFFNRVRQTISMAQSTVREPKLICTEIWSNGSPDLTPTIEIAPNQLPLMRAGLACLLTHSAGYYSFYPQTFRTTYFAEHMHVYHDFFNAYLGAPTTGGPTLERGAYKKDWEKGTVVYNPPGNPAYTITFPELRKSQRTKEIKLTHTVPTYDGDIFLKGSYTQLYPVEPNVPSVKPFPDTTYKNQFVGVTPKSNKVVSPKSKLVKISTIVKNQRVLLQKEEPGKAPQYYNTAGRIVKALPKSKK